MPMLGYKRKFKNIDSLKDDVFIINFDLKYSDAGALHIDNEIESPFDVGDYHIMIDDVFENFDEEVFKKYDNGIFLLSVCKYLVDNIPNVYSIGHETNSMIDSYLTEDIINDYDRIII